MLRRAWRLGGLGLVLAGLLTGAGLADPAGEVLARVNAAREAAGCAPLVAEGKLAAAAMAHSDAMARKGFFDHTGPRGDTAGDRIRAAGYPWRRFGENIAAGQASAEAVVAAWLDSRGHRRNILNCAFRETGIALTFQADDAPIDGNSAPYRYYWVQVFASR